MSWLSKKELIDKIEQHFTGCTLWMIYPFTCHITPSSWLWTHRHIIYRVSIVRLSLLIATREETSLIHSPHLSVMHSFDGSIALIIVLPWIERIINALYHPHVALLHCTLFSVANREGRITLPRQSERGAAERVSSVLNGCVQRLHMWSIQGFLRVMI